MSRVDGVDALDVLVVGEALIDVIRSASGVEERPGGSPANVALGLGRLGHGVAFLTALGRDERGRAIREHLEASRVDVLAASFAERRTSTAVATLAQDGSATYEFDLHWDLPAAPPAVTPRLVHTGSIAAFLEPGAGRVLELLRATDAAEIAFDPNIRPDLMPPHAEAIAIFDAVVRLCSVVKLSDEDAAWLFPGVAPEDVLARIVSAGPRLVAITRGGAGSLIAADGRVRELPAAHVAVADTIGAGDTYMASLISSVLDAAPGAPLDVGLIGRRAAAAAGVTVSRPGADLPTRAEVDAALGGTPTAG